MQERAQSDTYQLVNEQWGITSNISGNTIYLPISFSAWDSYSVSGYSVAATDKPSFSWLTNTGFKASSFDINVSTNGSIDSSALVRWMAIGC